MENSTYLKIEASDNLIVALQTIRKGSVVTIDGKTIEIKDNIPAKHKFSLIEFAPGDTAYMYGVTVGRAKKAMEPGTLISTENLVHATTEYSSDAPDYHWDPPTPYEDMPEEFMGFRRENGSAGTANFWIFVPMVFCSNQELLVLKDVLPTALGYKKTLRYQKVADELVKQLVSGGELSEPVISLDSFSEQIDPIFQNVDGVRFLTHSLGCGNTPEDIESLCALLANYITHPNVAGATVISLGCQKAEIAALQEEVRKRDPNSYKQVLYYDRQTWSGPADMLEVIIQDTLVALKEANKTARQPIPISELIIGVECGGSDGFSGISSNPVIGRTVDHLIGAGGSAILSEFPELCGVENELVARCTTKETADRFLTLLTSYRKKVQSIGFDFDLNPSPGNIRDGLITDAMKSAGAAKKAGTAPIVDAIDYAEQVTERGLNLLCTPGNDVESTTALVGAGANLIIFSTGLGTPTGNPIVPVLKIASNTDMAQRLEYMIDLDTGPIITGEKTIDKLAEELERLCIHTASGQYQSKATRLGQEDFIPWKRGVSL